ncbi:helix-turn-helix domain-containing protein [Puia dinghuensis]|uniref:AraC family transcriptional regulator n=1 Tax=Puia dinghuensis TaxID=1792502 RepID=A0A8J2UIS6_9BACT|nr:AraC family transcriptional regulator [Puia dinghuensis]GGB24329.1 AraC family transcriptional regulator [Puia dinghuensis]
MPFATQTLEEFYRSSLCSPKQTDAGHHFNVADIAERLQSGQLYPTYIRRDFYKIMLFRGDAQFHFGDETIAISGDSLLFFNPRVPYTYASLPANARGYFCVFKEDFFKEDLRINLDEVPLFLPGVKPIFSLDPGQCEELSRLFRKMLAELNSTYTYKYQLIRAYVTEIIYFAMKLAPLTYRPADTNASARITAVFLELLDRQFPVELSGRRLLLRTPKDFADKLAIHINYLNRAVKAQTGKTTSEHIFDRLAAEAKAMLRHTDMNIAEVGYSLGFQDQAHFNNFFRKRVHMSPSAFRLADTTAPAAPAL